MLGMNVNVEKGIMGYAVETTWETLSKQSALSVESETTHTTPHRKSAFGRFFLLVY